MDLACAGLECVGNEFTDGKQSIVDVDGVGSIEAAVESRSGEACARD